MAGLGNVAALGGGLGMFGVNSMQGMMAGKAANGIQDTGVSVTISRAAHQALAADPLAAGLLVGSGQNSVAGKQVDDLVKALESLLAMLNTNSAVGTSGAVLASAAAAVQSYQAMMTVG